MTTAITTTTTMTTTTSNRPYVGWQGGWASCFLHKEKDGSIVLLNYEHDTDTIHAIAGGRCYHTTRSGCGGDGYIVNLNGLVSVGGYRIDVAHVGSEMWCEKLGDSGWEIMFPFRSHSELTHADLMKWPVVLVKGFDLVLIPFDSNFSEALKDVLNWKLPRMAKEYKVTLEDKNSYGSDFTLRVYGEHCPINPWLFVSKDMMKPYEANLSCEWNSYGAAYELRDWMNFHLEFDSDGNQSGTAHTCKLGRFTVVTERLDADPLVTVDNCLLSAEGWHVIDGYKYHVAMKYVARGKYVRVACWTPVSTFSGELQDADRIVDAIVTVSAVDWMLNKDGILQKLEEEVRESAPWLVKKLAEERLNNELFAFYGEQLYWEDKMFENEDFAPDEE